MSDTGMTRPGPRDAPPLPEVSDGTQVSLQPLVTRPDGADHIVGRVETGTFIALPASGVRAIELLRSGHSCAALRQRLRSELGQDIDLAQLVGDLSRLGFVRLVDGRPVGGGEPPPTHLPGLRPAHVRWLFSPPMGVAWVAAVLAATVAVLREPELFPRYQDFFWSPSISAVTLVNAALAVGSIAAHELAHLFAARAHGLPARISISTRLVFLVAQTDVSAAWSLPRGQRYRIYLAGMALDVLVLSAAVLAQAYVPMPAPARAVLASLAMLLGVGVVLQFHVYLRTDPYFVLIDWLRCRDLYGDALRNLRWLVVRLWHPLHRWPRASPAHPLAPLPARERRNVQIYTWFMIGGSALALWSFAAYTIPVVAVSIGTAATDIWHGAARGEPGRLLDGAVALAYQVAFQALLISTLLRKHRTGIQRRRPATPSRQPGTATHPAPPGNP